MSRPMTPAERQRFHGYFPSLDVHRAVVTGEVSNVYNCVSWTVGIANAWLWPGNSLGDFDTFYRRFGYARSADGTVAAWGQSASAMTHGCVSGPNHGTRWESKCGGDLRIRRGLNELVGASYGRVIAFYRRDRLLSAEYAGLLKEVVRYKQIKSTLSPAEKKLLAAQVQALSSDVHVEFERAFEAWKATWFQGGLAISSVPQSRAVGLPFDALIALGPKILPLVVQKLADPENFLALTLYDAIQPDGKLLVQIGADDERILEGEQGRARRVVQAWFANQ